PNPFCPPAAGGYFIAVLRLRSAPLAVSRTFRWTLRQPTTRVARPSRISEGRGERLNPHHASHNPPGEHCPAGASDVQLPRLNRPVARNHVRSLPGALLVVAVPGLHVLREPELVQFLIVARRLVHRALGPCPANECRLNHPLDRFARLGMLRQRR